MDIKQEYREKFNEDVYSDDCCMQPTSSYSDKYVRWLEEQVKNFYTQKANGTLILTSKDAEIFFNAIMNPKEPNEALKKAMLKFINR